MSTFIIAEAGVNHNGELTLAHELIDAAAEAGADAIKFQTFNALELAGADAPLAGYQQSNFPQGGSQLEMLRKLELPKSWHLPLRLHAERVGLEFMSTAFDTQSLEYLSELGLKRYKIPSGELTNGPLLLEFSRLGKPLILSTGMASLNEVETAIATILWGMRNQSRDPNNLEEVMNFWSETSQRIDLTESLTLLHCTSQYPAPFEDVNLSAMKTLEHNFKLSIGYSDHTVGIHVAVAAVSLGARVIEKHLTLDRELEGPDHAASTEPSLFGEMVTQIRQIENAIGNGVKEPQESELSTREVARQKVIASSFIAKGEVFSPTNLTTRRAKNGVNAHNIWDFFSNSATRDYRAGEAIDEASRRFSQ